MTDPFEHFLRGYVAALLWSSTDEDNGTTVHLDAYGPSTQCLEKCRDDCWAFYQANQEDVDAAAGLYDLSRGDGADTGHDFAGHDFALTRNRHGVGFKDRYLPEDLAQRLYDAAQAVGECYPYLADNLVQLE